MNKQQMFELSEHCKAFYQNFQRLDIDQKNPDDVFELEQINRITNDILSVIRQLDYLIQPIIYSTSIDLTVGTRETETFIANNGEVLQKGDLIEFFCDYIHPYSWRMTTVGHFSDDERAKNLKIRVRGDDKTAKNFKIKVRGFE